MDSLRFSICKIMLSVNRDSFTSSSAVSKLLFYFFFPCPFALARISSTLLNRSGENGYPSLVSDLGAESFQLFTIEYNVSCRFPRNAIYHVEEVPYTPNLLNVFIILIFKSFFCISFDYVVFSPSFYHYSVLPWFSYLTTLAFLG